MRPTSRCSPPDARELLAQGCDGVALFGTTGEGPAFPVAARSAGLEALLEAGVPARRIVVSASAIAPADALALTRHALGSGVLDILLMPAFFLKAVDDEGLFRFYAEHIERAAGGERAGGRLRLLLYHIPSVSGIGLSFDLIGRLASAFPEVVAGVKDSGFDLAFTRGLLERFPALQILTGAESQLPQALAAGGAGTICGMANFMPGLLRRLIDTADPRESAALLDLLVAAERAMDQSGSFHPALRALLADLTGEPAWQRCLAPMSPLGRGPPAPPAHRVPPHHGPHRGRTGRRRPGLGMVDDRPAGLRIAADIGGTFTDLVAASGAGACLVHKIASTPAAPEQAVIAGIADLLTMAGATPGDVVEVLHGTTVGSNAILERKGARAGLLTTRGFRDVLEIGRLRTPELYDLAWDKPAPLIPRRHRLEVEERIGGQGEVVRPLDPASVVAAAERLLAAGIESLAVCFINSYRNPAHEEQAVALLRARYPELDVSASCEILPQIKEYERTSTVAVNAYIRPVLRRYLERLADGLAALGIRAPLLVVTSNGGMAGVRTAAARPVFFVGSGPAAGVVGAAALGQSLGEPDLIAFDMGGTTAKASLIAGGEVSRVQEYEFRDGISSPSRFIKAGGYMLKVPAIDVAEVGAGGGSLASVDPGGLLKVGPHSAGAAPGPACYGLGGARPTVTDANVVLGYLNPDFLAGGSLALDPARAERAVERELARPLGVSVLEAAFGVRAVVNANMARAIRAVTVERGLDPRDFTLVAFGGGGPVHAADLAAMLGIRRILLPSFPGVFTALGMLTGDVQLEFVRALVARLDELDRGACQRAARRARPGGGHGARRRGLARRPAGDRVRGGSAVRRPGQRARDRAPWTADRRGDLGRPPLALPRRLREALPIHHRRPGRAGQSARDRPRPARGTARLRAPDRGAGAGDTTTGERQVLFDRARGAVTVPVIERSALVGRSRAGPLIVESLDTTIAAPPGATLRGDAAGNLVMELPP